MNIIIVDDELVSLTVLKQLVEKLPDCCAQGFTDALAALAYCEQNDPDLVLVDYMMPVLNGIDFTRRLRAIAGRADTPVLMVTASGDGEVRDSALQSGINDFLNKPFDFVELQARATNMLALRASQKKLGQVGGGATGITAAASTPGSDTDNVLDVNMTRARLAADEALLSEIARIFMRTVPELLSSIETSLSRNDLKRAFGHAHSLKGAVAAFEAPEVFNSLARVEEHAKNHDAEAASAAFALAEALVRRLVRELASIVQRNGPGEAGA
ncbi:MAG: response regulator [Burkholderiales bacterium]